MEGEGKELRIKHNAKGAPVFLLMDANGELKQKWGGYKKAKFIKSLNSSLAG